MLTTWRNNNANSNVNIMADMNENIGDGKEVHNVCQHNDPIDSVSLLATYLWGSKQIDYILILPTLAEISVKTGHHQFNQHFTNDHNGIYIQFNAIDIFDTANMDHSHVSYWRLCMSRRAKVTRYISHL